MAGNDPIASIYQKIEREKVMINRAEALRRSSDNPVVQSSVDAQIKEAQRNLKYLEERLSELQMRRMGQGMENMNMNQNGGYSSQDPRSNTYGQGGSRAGYDQGGYGSPSGGGGYMDQLGAGSGMMPPRPPYGAQAPGTAIPKARPNYSKLDLIKADTRYLGPRFQLMLSQLTFKLSVEKQYKDGIEKLVRLYSDDGDRKSRADAEGRRIESNQKIQLLQQALKRYESLYVEIGGADEQDDDSINTPQLRKPLTGHLMMRIHAVKDVNHALTGRFTRGPETFVIVKVEDTSKGRTKATRTDKWTDELLNLEIDKANEIELTVYDKSGQFPTPIGMLWIRISDIVEEMRRNKINSELAGSQWVTAEQMNSGGGPGPGGRGGAPGQQGGMGMDPSGAPMGGRGPMGGGAQAPPGRDHGDPNIVEAWFSLEPVGSIKLSMSFTKQNRGKASFDPGLGRKGAVRQRKEEVQEQYGHKFVNQQFYSVMRCALCGEFLKNAAGMQCEDCKYLCHKNCYTKVVTKCISKSNSEADPDEEKLNHRIPHRFDPFTNLTASWCCHCGYMLPFGKKNARKCSECALTVHATCCHLVPDFCGMSMLRANEILLQIRGIPKKPPPIDHKRGGLSKATLRPEAAGRSPAPASSPYDQPPGQEPRPAAQTRASFGAEPQYEQLSISGPSQYGASAAQSAAKKATSQQADRPTHPPRVTSQDAAAAAASAAISGTQRASSHYSEPPPDYTARPGRTSGYGDHDAHMQQPDPRQQQQPQHPQYDPRAYQQFDSGYGQQQYAHHQQYHQQPQQPMKPAYNEPAPVQHQPQMNQPAVQQKPPQTEMAPPKQPQPSQQVVPQQQQQQQATARRIGLEHFNFLAVLGKGNFGKVMLAETKATKKLYAIKVLKKEFIIENDEVESTKSEKRVFLIANKERHPFLLNLHACFQTETRVYFVMEYISGGDLMLHIQRGQFGLKRAQFYAAEVCLALKYFHENGVIYRDLKLDNILLTLDGHIKIADYGLCKEDQWYGSTTSTFCGTPEFMAPEILLDKKYGRAVDWWAFGVLIYQMLLQQSPFRGEDEDEIYDAILADEPLYPIHMPRDSVSILQKLLTREPELRLGSGPTDAQEIMSHAFFHNVNWEDVREKKVPPPFMPTIKNATDTSNFDSEFTSVTPVLTPVQSILTPVMQEEFRGFSYSADFI